MEDSAIAGQAGTSSRIEVGALDGPSSLEKVTLRNRDTGAQTAIPCRALCIMIWAAANTAWLDGQVALDERGFVRTGADIGAGARYVLESLYETPRTQVAEVLRSLLTSRSFVVVDRDLLLRAIEVYEIDRLDFAEAYLVSCAETTGVERIASFDRSIDRLPTVQRSKPAQPTR